MAQEITKHVVDEAIEKKHQQFLREASALPSDQREEFEKLYGKIKTSALDIVRQFFESGKTIEKSNHFAPLCKGVKELLEQDSTINPPDYDASQNGKSKTPPLLRRFNKARTDIKRDLEVEVGMKKAKTVEEFGIDVINRARIVCGLEPKAYEPKDAEDYLNTLSNEQIQSFVLLAERCGENAVAELLSEMHSDYFPYSRRTIENLRRWIGKVQKRTGEGRIEDIPVKVLTLRSLRSLRKMLFNSFRDIHEDRYIEKGLGAVTEAIEEDKAGILAKHESNADEELLLREQQRFADELIAEFQSYENMPNPSRLLSTFGKDEFTGKQTMYPGRHQRIDIKEIKDSRQFLIANGMGSGKTGSAIAAFEHLRDRRIAFEEGLRSCGCVDLDISESESDSQHGSKNILPLLEDVYENIDEEARGVLRNVIDMSWSQMGTFQQRRWARLLNESPEAAVQVLLSEHPSWDAALQRLHDERLKRVQEANKDYAGKTATDEKSTTTTAADPVSPESTKLPLQPKKKDFEVKSENSANPIDIDTLFVQRTCALLNEREQKKPGNWLDKDQLYLFREALREGWEQLSEDKQKSWATLLHASPDDAIQELLSNQKEYVRVREHPRRALVLYPSKASSVWETRLTNRKGGYFKPTIEPEVVLITSGTEGREQDWKEANTSDYIGMSLEMSKEKTAGQSHVDLAKKTGADFLIVDEAHNARNPEGKYTDIVYQISQSPSVREGYTVLLTGTPIPNTLDDVGAQLRLLHAGQDRAEDVRDEFNKQKRINFHNIRDLVRAILRNNTRLVRNHLLLRMRRRTTEQCLPVDKELQLELPDDNSYQRRFLNPIAQARYQSFFEDSHYEAPEKIRLLRNVVTNRKPYRNAVDGAEDKYRHLCETIDEYMEEWEAMPEDCRHSGKVVIFTSRDARGITRDLRHSNEEGQCDGEEFIAGLLREKYGEKGIPVFILDGSNTGMKALKENGEYLRDIDGTVMTATKQRIAEFRDYDGPALFVTRYDVAGEGIDLTCAARGIGYSPPDTDAELDQGMRRLYRRGQKHDVRFRLLMVENTIERGHYLYSQKKVGVIDEVLKGRPLTEEEKKMFADDKRAVQRGGYLAYEVMSPGQKMQWILRRLRGRGKEGVRDFFAQDDGRFAKDFADYYNGTSESGYSEWETSYQANNARFIQTILNKYLANDDAQEDTIVADIACGGLTTRRMLQNHDGVRVKSSDICEETLEVGRQMCASLYNDAVPEEDIDAVAMDELPYDDNSVDIAVHSLSLHDTMHNSRRAKKAGGERIRALQTLNRVLKKEDGVAVITLPPHCFENEQGFVAFLNILDKYFGFDVLLEDCGHVRSTDRTDEKKYEAYVVVVRKREDAAPAEQIMEQMKKEDWYALDLFFFKESTEGRRKPKQPEEEEEREDQSGSFHGEFEVSLYGESQELSYVPTEIQERERDLHDEAKRQYNTIESRIHEMREKYGSFAAIPEEELLAISPEEIKDEERESQIAYYKALLEKYGSAEAIPYDEINKHSSVVLVRASVKRGVYLCIAPLEDENKKNGKIKRWYKNRFFIEEDPDYQTEMKERKYKAAQKSAEARKKKKAS